MTHPQKAELGENEDDFNVGVCDRLSKQFPPNNLKQSHEGNIPHFSL
jgi:hypothetical protein